MRDTITQNLNHIIRNAIQSFKGIGNAATARAKQLEGEYNESVSNFSIIPPVAGRIIRGDRQGDGHFGASRGIRVHAGIDWECVPGEPVLSMIQGKVVRILFAYAGENWQGIEIANDFLICRILYVMVNNGLVGNDVMLGHEIGRAQDISERYGGGMKSHIHAEVFINYETCLLEDKT